MAKRYGRQEPTFEVVGKYAYTDGEQAAALASEFWDEPLEWQQHFLNVMLARNKRDKYAFKTVGCLFPDKTASLGVFVLVVFTV